MKKPVAIGILITSIVLNVVLASLTYHLYSQSQHRKRQLYFLRMKIDNKPVVIERKGFRSTMGPWRKVGVKLTPIDPNDFLEYKVDSPRGYKVIDIPGRIKKKEFGIIKKGEFIVPKSLFNYHIKKSEDIFNDGHKIWKLKVKKKKNMDLTGCCFLIKQEVIDKNKKVISEMKIYAFPIKDHGRWFEAHTEKVLTTWTKGIDGHYDNFEGDAKDSMVAVIHIPEKSSLRIAK